MLLGAAILGAVAAKKYPTVIEGMKALNAPGQVHLLLLLLPSIVNRYESFQT